MVPAHDIDHTPCSHDLPLELRRQQAAAPRGETDTARMVSGLTLTAQPDDVVARDLALLGLLIPQSGRTISAAKAPHH